MFSTDFIFRQQENLVDNQKCWAGFRPLCNKMLLGFDEKKQLRALISADFATGNGRMCTNIISFILG